MISFNPIAKVLVAAALMASSTAGVAQSAPCQGNNCVLPLPAPVAPDPVVSTPVEAAAPIAATEVATAKGFGLLPLLLGAAFIGTALYFILDEEDEEDSVSA